VVGPIRPKTGSWVRLDSTYNQTGED